MNSTVPVTMSGFWNSSPSFFQKAALANTCSYASRSFSSLIFFGFLSAASPPLAGAVAVGGGARCSAATSVSGSTSASMTRRLDLVRSWLRSRRTVSRFASTSSLPPAMKPATSTR